MRVILIEYLHSFVICIVFTSVISHNNTINLLLYKKSLSFFLMHSVLLFLLNFFDFIFSRNFLLLLNSMQFTYQDYVISTHNTLILFKIYLANHLSPVSQWSNSSEKIQLAQSGNMFIYMKNKSEIKKWINEKNWSRSKIWNSFLIYYELSFDEEKKMIAKDAR